MNVLTSIFDTEREPNPWIWNGPRGEPGDYERCYCFCHDSNGRAVHVVACCEKGWKPTFQLLERRKREAEERRTVRSTTYRPAHGGYPDANG